MADKEPPRRPDYEGTMQVIEGTDEAGNPKYKTLKAQDGKNARVALWKQEPNGKNNPALKGKLTLPDGTVIYLSLWQRPKVEIAPQE